MLPLGLTWGTYQIKETDRKGFGALLEGKVIVDKTFGSVTYGCFECCGYTDSQHSPYNPILSVPQQQGGDIAAIQACGGYSETITGYYGSWWTDNAGVVSVPSWATWQGVTAGSTYGRADGTIPYSDGEAVERPSDCRTVDDTPETPVNVDDFTLSSAQTIMDGQQGSFSVSPVSGSSAISSYSWSFSAPSGAGNAPNVNFTAGSAATTNTDGHWFALPDVACPTSAQVPAYWNAMYTINASVAFNDGGSVSHSTTLTVNALWNPAGFVDPNDADVTGGPTIGVDSSGIWRVIDIGTLKRKVPTIKHINVLASSQFYNKTSQHEQVHLDQWNSGRLFGGRIQSK